MKYLTQPIEFLLQDFDGIDISHAVADFVGLKKNHIVDCILHKKSIDARKKDNLKFVCSFVFEAEKQPAKNCQPFCTPQNFLQNVEKTKHPKNVIVVGSGPCGLFAARYLTEAGHSVTIVERGADITLRKKRVEDYFKRGTFDPNSNIQFGLGGAGTFSDGKLTSGISSPFSYTVFREFADCGAPKEILYSATPHIGTDFLVSVVANLRDKILNNGGKFLFETTLLNLKIQNGEVCGVYLRDNKTQQVDFVETHCVVLALGHSARETLTNLHASGVEMHSKPFAVGVRIEHKRELISQAQFGRLALSHRDLSSASYKLAANFENGRSCYSFCMCPGGVVVAANSTEKAVVTNGMSDFLRMAENSNSALVVNVSKEDFGFGVFDGIKFQQKLEFLAHQSANQNDPCGFKAPCQNVVDFLKKEKSVSFDVTPSYPLGTKSVNLWEILPTFVAETLRRGIVEFGKKITGFDKGGVLTAVESRTSSPVKILRDNETLQSNLKGLFPCGEGAGFAGGIVSAAVDGLKVAKKI